MSDTDSHPAQCQKCGAPLAGDVAGGLCPRCLMALNLGTETEVPGETGSHGTKVVPPPPAPGEIAALFPQLEILECLGRGGMGVVYKARQPKLDRLVALKLLAPERGADARFAERFTREAQALARLSHTNIVTVYDFGEAGGHYYLLMEFVDGLSLRQLLQSRKPAPEEALAIVPRICEALQYAHEQGIVHRDIKPENILLDKQGRLKIADFGIAKIIDPVGLSPGEGAGARGASLTQGQIIGTPHYMAPEQIEHPLQVDHRADIYSLGVVFYEMLTGELPLGKFAPPSKKVQVDVRLDEVVLHTLEKEPERRYQQASQVKSDVETIATAPRRSGRESAPVEDQREGTTATARSNAKEAFIVFAGTLVFVLLLSMVMALSHTSVVPIRGFVFGVCVLGLIICALSLAGFWPFPSPWFPEPNFSSRNLGSLRRSVNGTAESGARFSHAAIVGAVWTGGLAILIGAVFLANYLPRRSRPETARSHNGSFGPVIERVVTNMIDFDSGALADLPLPTRPGERDAARYDWINGPNDGVSWMRKHGMDAIDANHGLIGVDMLLVPLSARQWDSLSSAGLQEKLQALNLPAAPPTDILNNSPGIYGFKTREGGLGIVQVLDSHVPQGVKVRYKLAPLSDTHTPARQEALIYQTVPVTRGALSQVVAATGTLNPVTADASQWRIEASVNEADVVGVEVGQDVRFTLDAFPGRTFTGKVLEVGNTPVRQDNTVNYTARITVNNPDPKFKPGMTANVAFIVAHRENVPRIPNAALRFRPAWGSTLPPGLQAKEPNLRIVYVMRAGAIDLTNGAPFTIGQPEAVRIRIGISDGVSTEVIEGLQEGDRVLIGIRRAEHSRAPRLEGLKERQSARCEDSLQAGESNRWSRRALPSPQVTRGEI